MKRSWNPLRLISRLKLPSIALLTSPTRSVNISMGYNINALCVTLLVLHWGMWSCLVVREGYTCHLSLRTLVVIGWPEFYWVLELLWSLSIEFLNSCGCGATWGISSFWTLVVIGRPRFFTYNYIFILAIVREEMTLYIEIHLSLRARVYIHLRYMLDLLKIFAQVVRVLHVAQ